MVQLTDTFRVEWLIALVVAANGGTQSDDIRSDVPQTR